MKTVPIKCNSNKTVNSKINTSACTGILSNIQTYMYGSPVVDPEIVGGVGCGRSRGVGCGEGAPPPHVGGVYFSNLDLKMASFGALWVPVGDASRHPPPRSATAEVHYVSPPDLISEFSIRPRGPRTPNLRRFESDRHRARSQYARLGARRISLNGGRYVV